MVREHGPLVSLLGVKLCLKRNPGVLGSSCTGSSEFFAGVSLGKKLQSPSRALVKSRKDMNYVRYSRDMTEILLKSKKLFIQSINGLKANSFISHAKRSKHKRKGTQSSKTLKHNILKYYLANKL